MSGTAVLKDEAGKPFKISVARPVGKTTSGKDVMVDDSGSQLEDIVNKSLMAERDRLLDRVRGRVSDDFYSDLQNVTVPSELAKYRKMVDALKFKDDSQPDSENPPQGSVVSLQRGGNKMNTETEYDDYRSMADDLYRKARDGDEEASRALDRLWVNAGKRIKAEDISVNVSGCPRCSEPMRSSEGDICPKCGFDTKPFVRGGGEVF